MQLISTIINELTDVSISLTSPLLKTKVLASRIQNKELLEWTNNELTGYRTLESVPTYRKTKGEICADYINGNYHVSNQVIDMPKFDQEITESLYQMHFTQSLQTIESLYSNSNTYLAESLSGGQKEVLVGYLQNQNPYLSILNIFRRTPINFITDILSNIRGRLLEFMLQLEEKYDYVSEIKGLKSYNTEITKIMNTTIINNGDSNIVNTGNDNDII